MTSHSNCRDVELGIAFAGTRPARGAARGPVGRALAALDGWIASVLFWQSVSRTIRRLSVLSDTELQRLGFERSEIVARVYEAARTEQERRR